MDRGSQAWIGVKNQNQAIYTGGLISQPANILMANGLLRLGQLTVIPFR
ncbi:MAG: hypothetical protein ACM3MK_02180 [Chitinophagales bacterium]